MKGGKMRIKVILNGGEAKLILQTLSKYLDKETQFEFNQNELNANINYDYDKPPQDLFRQIAMNKNFYAKIEIGNSQQSVKETQITKQVQRPKQNNKPKSKRKVESKHDDIKIINSEAGEQEATKQLNIVKKPEDIFEFLGDTINAKTDSVFKNKLSELLGFSRGIRRQVFEDMIDAAINCPINSFQDIRDYMSRKKKKPKEINISYCKNKIEKFFERKGYKIDLEIFFKGVRQLNISRQTELMQKNIEKVPLAKNEGKKIILPLEDLQEIYVFKKFFLIGFDKSKSIEENINVLLDIFKSEAFDDNMRDAFERYIKIALNIKVLKRETLEQNILLLPDDEKPKVTFDELNQFLVNWFKERKGVYCGIERFLRLLKKEIHYVKLK